MLSQGDCSIELSADFHLIAVRSITGTWRFVHDHASEGAYLHCGDRRVREHSLLQIRPVAP